MTTLLIFAASFLGVACLVGGLATLLGRNAGEVAMEERLDYHTGTTNPLTKSKQNEPNLLASPLNDVPSAMEDFVKKFFNLRAFLQQADSQLTPSKFIGLSLAIGLGTSVVLPFVRIPLAAAP